MRSKGTPGQRLLSNIRFAKPPVGVAHLGPCWIWQKSCDRYGYGHISLTKGKMVATHRLAYALIVGDLEPGVPLDHMCDVRACCNPAHLVVSSVLDNTLRGKGPTAINAAKTHCIHGHKFTLENTRLTPERRRNCRQCARDRPHRSRQIRQPPAP